MSDDDDRAGRGESRFVLLGGGDDVLEVDDAKAFIAFINVENPDAQDMLIDPLPLLRKKLKGVVTGENDWRVTVNRVDAEIAAHNPGPHHLLVGGLVLKAKHRVHCTVHRSEEDPKKH
jgi:hypothetical protein